MNSLTLVYSYYDNPLMLSEQYRIWSNYPDELKDKVSVIVVDDASPRWAALDVVRPVLPKLSIYRVKVDMPWHQDGARNLGAYQADEGWLFLSDMDHALPTGSLQKLLEQTNERVFFTFPRIDAPHMTPNAKGPGHNIFALTKKMYWDKMGGYDEDMCGQYGSDGAPRRRLLRHATNVVLKTCPVIRYPREVIDDASTTNYERRGPINDQRRLQTMARKRSLGRTGKITTLDFEWDRVL
jgi:hypothetical protein